MILRLKTSVLRVFLTLCICPLGVWSQADIDVSVNGFTANVGQWPDEVLFVARQNGSDVWITRTGVVHDRYTVTNTDGTRQGTISREAFRGVNNRFRLSMNSEIARVNFIHGNDQQKWFSAPVYESIALMDYYPGVTFTFQRQSDGSVNRTMILGEGADITQISFEVLGGASPKTANVSPSTSTVYGTYLGGTNTDAITDIEYLPKGEVVVAGGTTNLSFPEAVGGYSFEIKGSSDGFVARLDRKLHRVISYTYIGGAGEDRVTALTKDPSNRIYVCGETSSSDFPITSGVSGKQYRAGIDAFVAKFDSTLSKLLVGFYHGGNNDDRPRSIRLDQNNLIYVSGRTNSTTNFPVTFPVTVQIEVPFTWPKQYIDVPGGGGNVGQTDVFVATFTSTGALRHSRYFGGDGIETLNAMAIDASSNVYLTGSTTSTNFETAPHKNDFWEPKLTPYDDTFNGGRTDAFLVKLTSELALSRSEEGTYSTLYGGNGDEEGVAVFVDGTGKAYMIGNTTSSNIPTTGLVNTQPIGQKDLFFTVFASSGRELLNGMYFGGSGVDEMVSGHQFHSGSSAVVVGSTSSTDFPVYGEGASDVRAGTSDGFIAILSPSASQYATLVSGSGADTIVEVVVDPQGDLYYISSTTSQDLATQDSSYKQFAEGRNIFVAKYAFGAVDLTIPAAGDTWCVGSNQSISWSARGMSDSVRYLVEVSPVGTSDWIQVAGTIKGNGYRWTIPSMPAGRYVMRLTSTRGHVSQMLAPFTIEQAPSITMQPKNVGACEGSPVSLSVATSGNGLTYQWRKNGTTISGATDSLLTITSVDATTIGQYTCVVSGACSPSAISQNAFVSIAPSTTITNQPIGQTIEEGRPLRLVVEASGGVLTYQWRKNGEPISGATNEEYVIASTELSDAGTYKCDVVGGCGSESSDDVTVIITPATGVEEDITYSDFSIQLLGPVPAGDVVSISLRPTEPVNFTVRFIDQHGRLASIHDVGLVGAVVDIPHKLSSVFRV